MLAPRITSVMFIGFSFFFLLLSSLIYRRRLLLTALLLHGQKREFHQILLVEDPVTCCWTGPYNQQVKTTNRILRDVVEIGAFLDTHMFLYLESAYCLLRFKSVNAFNYIAEFTLY